jgi:YgiT-type zinc finger domain-containing protein
MMSRTPCPLDPIPAPDALKARMTDWRTAHPRATFADLEIEATRQLAAMRAELIAVALVAAVPDTTPACPTCGGTMQRVGTRTRTLSTSQAEPVTVTGHRDRCSACGAELFPPR